MGSRHSTLALVSRMFPGRREVLQRVYHEQPGFRELCHDYGRCSRALERWRRLDGAEAAARIREYAELLDELLVEIERWLDGVTVRASGAGETVH